MSSSPSMGASTQLQMTRSDADQPTIHQLVQLQLPSSARPCLTGDKTRLPSSFLRFADTGLMLTQSTRATSFSTFYGMLITACHGIAQECGVPLPWTAMVDLRRRREGKGRPTLTLGHIEASVPSAKARPARVVAALELEIIAITKHR
ncbi:hypothetical protein E8E12_002882 [Didymella heteroderae]|uniref:Uncharacterized protein n=1 Tax=Didymella heteroderae TaxID=1769908 RepID=A0A9P4WNI2_9PLEO|nr:hypothetical protein E8E12_002882 [Didymella heteroderae]